jgi:hypothetical protein
LTLRVPADWKLDEIQGTAAEQRSFGLTMVDQEEGCALNVIDRATDVNPRGGPAWVASWRNDLAPQLWGEPVPHEFVPPVSAGRDWGRITAFVRANGRTFELDLQGTSACLEQAGADFLAAAATLKAKAPEWPPVTKDYRVTRVGDYRLAVHRSVSEATTPFAGAIRDAQRICDRLYGRMPPPAPGESAPVFYLHSDRAQQEAILPRLKEVTTVHSLCLSGLCIFGMSNDPGGEDPVELIPYTITEFNAFWRWGTTIPMWVRVGERITVANLLQTGADLPRVTAQRLGWREGLTIRPLPELTLEAFHKDWKGSHRQAFFYTVYFRAGPDSCQAAYRAFLDDVRKSCDPDGAARRHLEPLGYDRLCLDAAQFMQEHIALAPAK